MATLTGVLEDTEKYVRNSTGIDLIGAGGVLEDGTVQRHLPNPATARMPLLAVHLTADTESRAALNTVWKTELTVIFDILYQIIEQEPETAQENCLKIVDAVGTKIQYSDTWDGAVSVHSYDAPIEGSWWRDPLTEIAVEHRGFLAWRWTAHAVAEFPLTT